MYRYMLKKRLHCLLFIVLLLMSGSIGPLFSLVMAAIVDSAGKSGEELLAALMRGIAYVAVSILLQIAYRCIKEDILADARYHLKEDLFAGIMRRNIADFETANSAEYINELTNNMNQFETVYYGNIAKALECLMSFGAASAVVIMVQPFMLALMVLLALVTIGVTRLTAGILEKSTEKYVKSVEEYTAEVKDDFGGFRLVHSFGILANILVKHEKKNRDMEKAKRENINHRLLCTYAGQSVGLLSTVFVMAMAAWFSLQGMFSAGMVIAFGHLIGNIVSPITQISSIAANFRAARPLRARFGRILVREEEGRRETLTDLRDAIAIEQLSFGYQEDREIISRLSFRFRAGCHYAIVGSSGSGKSTLMSLLLGYYRNYSGHICFDGIELRELDRNCIGKLIGAVSQDTFLFNDTIKNNITLFDENYTDCEVKEAISKAGLEGLVGALPEGISTLISENGRNFSGGEKQRISLARALLRKNKVLLFDEFTANLDERTAREIESRLLSLEGCLIITVTHRLNPEILRQYDRILVLSQGRITEAGSYDELKAKCIV